MSYTIVGMFPDKNKAEEARIQLQRIGVEQENYNISNFEHEGELDENYQSSHLFEEDEKTSNFWDWLFGENQEEKSNYSYAGTQNAMITVYADNLDEANEAKAVMNNVGAINVSKFSEDYVTKNRALKNENSKSVSEDERARIIAKAKNDLYFTDTTRNYKWRRGEGMTTDMDSLGNKDEN